MSASAIPTAYTTTTTASAAPISTGTSSAASVSTEMDQKSGHVVSAVAQTTLTAAGAPSQGAQAASASQKVLAAPINP